MLNPSSSRRLFLTWAIMATVLVGVLQISYATTRGGVGSLIRVGERHSVRELIENEIPGVSLAPGIGHDGQLFYTVALDLRARWAPEYLEPFESVPYRYRRIAFPAVSSLFGILDGSVLAWSMAAVSAMAAGVAAGATALIARQIGRPPLVAASVVLNPGVWLSGALLTADNLALAAGMMAVLLILRGKVKFAVGALAVAALTKEVALVFAIGLAAYSYFQRTDGRTAAWLLAGPSAALGAWLFYVQVAIGNVLDSSGNIGPPLAGLIEASSVWRHQSTIEIIYTAIMVMFTVVGVLGLLRSPPLWRWLTWLWIAVAFMSSHLVWDLGNNSIRTLAPIVVLTALGWSDRYRQP